MAQKISVLIATFNRAEILSDTLSSFIAVRGGDMDIDWVIIDNNSTDSTRHVIRQYEDRLKITYIFQPRPGKNAALNKAIEENQIGDIVVFTDDDVTPNPEWLVEVGQACIDYPQYQIFGGRILPKWPDCGQPSWALSKFVQMFVFAFHDLGDDIIEYHDENLPFGGNYWLRKEIFQQGYRFNENVGPQPKNRIMGSESSFLVGLKRAGYPILYYPKAFVSHRIQESECNLNALYKRAFRLGRGEIYISGFPRPILHDKFLFGWKSYSILKISFAVLCWAVSFLYISGQKRITHRINALRVLGNALESLRIG